jgi:hypothetical protein
MPHPRKHLKRTGDTHPPELELRADHDEEVPAFGPPPAEEPQDAATIMAVLPSPPVSAPARHYLDAAREQVRARPVAALVGAFVLGLVLARI